MRDNTALPTIHESPWLGKWESAGDCDPNDIHDERKHQKHIHPTSNLLLN